MVRRYTKKKYINKRLLGGEVIISSIAVKSMGYAITCIITACHHSAVYHILNGIFTNIHSAAADLTSNSYFYIYNNISAYTTNILKLTDMIMELFEEIKDDLREVATTNVLDINYLTVKVTELISKNTEEISKKVNKVASKIVENLGDVTEDALEDIGYSEILVIFRINIDMFVYYLKENREFNELIEDVVEHAKLPPEFIVKIEKKEFLGLFGYDLINPGFLKNVSTYLKEALLVLQRVTETTNILPTTGSMFGFTMFGFTMKTNNEKKKYMRYINFYKEKFLQVLHEANRESLSMLDNQDALLNRIKEGFNDVMLKANTNDEIRHTAMWKSSNTGIDIDKIEEKLNEKMDETKKLYLEEKNERLYRLFKNNDDDTFNSDKFNIFLKKNIDVRRELNKELLNKTPRVLGGKRKQRNKTKRKKRKDKKK